MSAIPGSDDAERLREALVDLERSKSQEHEARLVSEHMVACLRTFTTHSTPERIMPDLLATLRPVLGFDEVFLLTPDPGGGLVAGFASVDRLLGSRWQADGMFARVTPGRPIVVFDVGFVPEWAAQPPALRGDLRSALHIALRDQRRPAYLVCCHREVGYFGQRHLRLAAQFAPLASQALETIEHTSELRRINAELRREAAARQEAEAERVRLGHAVEQVAEAIVVTDVDGVITYVNPAFERITGFTRAEAVGQTPRLVRSDVHDESFFSAMWQRLLAGEVWSGRLVNRHRDGRLVHVDATISPVRDASGTVVKFVAVERDVTRMLEMEDQLRQAQKLESIGQLAAGIAHEINTPIQFIGDNTRFAVEGMAGLARAVAALRDVLDGGAAAASGPPAAVARRVLEEVDLSYLLDEIPRALAQNGEGVERVSQIVRAMKAFSHPGSHEPTPADLNQAIGNTATISCGEWRHVAILDLDLQPDLPQVPVRIGEFNQAVLNLVVNAAHAIAERRRRSGSAKLGRIRITTRRDGAQAVLTVRDDGCGIPAALRHRIFEPFFTTKEVGHGSGQGLALARAAILRLGGEISFDSTEDAGTAFTIRLPIA